MSKRDMFRFSYQVSMLADDTAEMMLYGSIIEDMPEEWKWSKEDKSAADFKKAVDKLRSDGATKLLLRINSPGGICTESIAMRSILASAGFDEVTIRIEGMCASAATVIATMPGAHVQIAEGSEYMIHNPWGAAVGNAADMERYAEHLHGIEQTIREFYAKRTGQTDEQIKDWMDAETWFSAKDAVKYGFADELMEDEMMTAACVSPRQMETMMELYKAVPEDIAVEEEPHDEVSNGTPIAGEPSEINEQEANPMELENLTLDQLREGNPALFDAIRQSAVDAERERLSDIDALTIPGYEEMAAQAKADGTSAMDFQKQLVSAMRQKGADFLQARATETAPAQEVAGDAPQSKSEEQEINDAAKDIAGYATGHMTGADGMF